MGVEPTSAGITDTHTVLKTGRATGPHPPPWQPNLRSMESSMGLFATIKNVVGVSYST